MALEKGLMSRIPVLLYLLPLKMVMSWKFMQLLDTTAVYLMGPILSLQCDTSWLISRGVLSKIIKMSSMNLSHTCGCGALPGREGLCFHFAHEEVGQHWRHGCSHGHSFEFFDVLVCKREGVSLEDEQEHFFEHVVPLVFRRES